MFKYKGKQFKLETFASKVGFYGGAKRIYDNLCDDEIALLDYYMDGMSFKYRTQINNFIWLEAFDIINENPDVTLEYDGED